MKTAVITPTRNRAGENGGYLAQAMKSIELQDADTVHVIVDDGSIDRTPEFVRDQPNQDKIIYIRREKPKDERLTASIASNVGIKAVLGGEGLSAQDIRKLQGVGAVTFLHSDDVLAEGSLERRSQALQDSGSAMVHGDNFLITASSEIYGLIRGYDLDRNGWKRVLAVADFPHHTEMFEVGFLRKLGLYDEDISMGEDADMTVRAIKEANRHGRGLVRISDPLMYYRRHGDTITDMCLYGDLDPGHRHRLVWRHSQTPGEAFEIYMMRALRKPYSYLPKCARNLLRPLKEYAVQRMSSYRDPFLEKVVTSV